MKKIIFALLLLPALLLSSGCGSSATSKTDAPAKAPAATANTAANASSKLTGKKVLVAYFSWGGNTKTLAEAIQKKTGGDIFRIETTTPYPTDYKACTDYAKKELADKTKPALKAKPDFSKYDVIFLGYPNWWSNAPMPIATLLDGAKLNGKIIVPFVTHGGGGEASTVSSMKSYAGNAKVLDALVVSGGSVGSAGSNIDAWLNKLTF